MAHIKSIRFCKIDFSWFLVSFLSQFYITHCVLFSKTLQFSFFFPQTVKQRSQKGEGQIPATQFLHTYLTYIRLTKTIERNLLLAESLKANLPSNNVGGGASSGATGSSSSSNNKKVTKPQDLIRIYDIILQVSRFSLSPWPIGQNEWGIFKPIRGIVIDWLCKFWEELI